MSNTLLYVVVVLIWGSTWLAIEFQLGIVAPEVSVFYRYALAAVLLFAWCLSMKRPMKFSARAHLHFLLLGALLFCINYILAYHAQRYVISALVAIAFSMILWMNIVNSRLFFGTHISGNVIIGALLGIVGTALMFWPSIRNLSLTDSTVVGALLAIAGTYSASLGNMVSQSAQHRGLPILQSNAWGMFYGAIFCGCYVAYKGQPLVFDTSPSYLLSFIYLVVFGSIIAFNAYLELLGRIGAHKAGYASILFPVVALILSVQFEGVTITGGIAAGMLLALLGNYFVMRPESVAQDDKMTQR